MESSALTHEATAPPTKFCSWASENGSLVVHLASEITTYKYSQLKTEMYWPIEQLDFFFPCHRVAGFHSFKLRVFKYRFCYDLLTQEQ